jgi:acyl-CoA reductase-like NAD-dependent aldehyde dehydrogenase
MRTWTKAVPAIVQSAFSYQGQKCSALSRLILLDANYDRALERLVEATRALRVGLPSEPGTIVGPVIDAGAHQRVLRYIEIGKTEGRLVFQGAIPRERLFRPADDLRGRKGGSAHRPGGNFRPRAGGHSRA